MGNRRAFRATLSGGVNDVMAKPALTELAPDRITLNDVRNNPKAKRLIDGANEVLRAMGYTEHGHRHVSIVSSITGEASSSIREATTQLKIRDAVSERAHGSNSS